MIQPKPGVKCLYRRGPGRRTIGKRTVRTKTQCFPIRLSDRCRLDRYPQFLSPFRLTRCHLKKLVKFLLLLDPCKYVTFLLVTTRIFVSEISILRSQDTVRGNKWSTRCNYSNRLERLEVNRIDILPLLLVLKDSTEKLVIC